MILVNEVLYQDSEEQIYKTMKGDLYGMYSSKRGVLVKPCFLHIFKFKGDSTVVINQKEQYLEMDFNGITAPLAANKKALYNKYLIKNSRCNCYGSEQTGRCLICRGYGQIVNTYGRKQISNLFNW